MGMVPDLRIAAVAVLALGLQACVSKTMIHSRPPGAVVYIDGQMIGTTPVEYGDNATSGTVKLITLKKEGYADLDGLIRKDDVKTGRFIAGMLLYYPRLWAEGYPEVYTFELEPEYDAIDP